MENALSNITIFEGMTLEQIDLFIEKAKQEIDRYDSLKLLGTLTVMSKIIDGVKEAVKDQMIEEASRFNSKEFTHAGLTFQLKSKKTYKYDHCQAWQALNDDRKKLEKLMQSTDKEIADTETGEIIPPAQWTSTEYITVTLNKR
jgi:hypothetical protein